MWRVFIGVALVVAGIAAFIEAHSHRPKETSWGFGTEVLSQTAYDLLRIGGWALVLVVGVLVVMGLIRYWADARRGRGVPGG
jgi:hypothetical protein